MLLLKANTNLLVLELEPENQAVQDTKLVASQHELLSDTISCPVDNAITNFIKVNSKNNKRHVYFSAEIKEVCPTLHVLDYTFEEKRKTWYNLHEFDQIKKERRSTIKRMNNGSKLKKGQYTRGLEAYTREGLKIRQQHISDSIKAVVLIKQSSKKDDSQNERDIGQIAQAYRVHSLPCQLAAYKRGLSDHHAAVDESDCDSGGIADDELEACDHDAPSSSAVVSWKRGS
mmetsp:Transcript_44687/g.107790  ORF Transcript_44687/g.107790 Transcript_44687/m.107790 type:complete len:230 (+) Transcript_44687:189-878(+)